MNEIKSGKRTNTTQNETPLTPDEFEEMFEDFRDWQFAYYMGDDYPDAKNEDEDEDEDVPTLMAYDRDDGHGLAVWCRHCDGWHLHGQGNGHRMAHCHVEGSPYIKTGYVLKSIGKSVPTTEFRYETTLSTSTLKQQP